MNIIRPLILASVNLALAPAWAEPLASTAQQQPDTPHVDQSPGRSDPITVRAADFGAIPDDGQDDVRAIQAALAACQAQGHCKLVFQPGQYDFFPTFAEERYCYISNNDEGLKRIAFLIDDHAGLTLDGQGARFIFHGFINPFIVSNSRNITFTNFSVDFARPFHSEAIILGHDQNGMDVEIRPGFPFKVYRGMLLFTDGIESKQPLTTVSKGNIFGSHHTLEYDTEKRETAYMVWDFAIKGVNGFPATQVDGRKVRLHVPGLKGTPGNTLVFGPNHRKYPGFAISDCASVLFTQVTIHHSGGMGILGQRSNNITVDHCQVTPSDGRMISTTADATHFVNCTGTIKLTHNLFENQQDDATNIHGIYVQIIEMTAENAILVQLKHIQQHGFDFLTPGTTVEFVRSQSMITYAKATVASAKRINKEITAVTFSEPLPDGLVIGDAIASIRDYPTIEISDNIIRNNRARGMLLNCRGKTVVRNNYFHTPGAAILFEGDAFFWYEQGGVRDCVIRDNVFDNCGYGVWGKAVIDVKAGIREDKETSRYNRNVRIEGNTFRMYDEGTLLNAYCVDGLIWRNNKIEQTSAYPARKKKLERFQIRHCDNVVIED